MTARAVPSCSSNSAISAWCDLPPRWWLPGKTVTSLAASGAPGRYTGIAPSSPSCADAAIRGGTEASPALRLRKASARTTSSSSTSSREATSRSLSISTSAIAFLSSRGHTVRISRAAAGCRSEPHRRRDGEAEAGAVGLRNGGRPPTRWLLPGIARCGECGGYVDTSGDKDHMRYRCLPARQGRHRRVGQEKPAAATLPLWRSRSTTSLARWSFNGWPDRLSPTWSPTPTSTTPPRTRHAGSC